MDERSQQTWEWLKKHVLNKYVITVFVAFILLFFVGEHNALRRISRERQYRELLKEKNALQKQNKQLSDEIQAFENDPEKSEGYAREIHHMHTDNEDLFLIDDN